MAIVYYVTNLRVPAGKVEGEDGGHRAPSADSARGNRTRQFLMRVANRVFTDQTVSQVEIVAHLLEHGTEFENNEAWAFLNVSSLRRPGRHGIVCLDSYLSMNYGVACRK